MKFLVDNQLPGALTRFLVAKGVECKHVLELDLAGATDAEIWTYASRHGFVVISKDEDFFYLANSAESKAQLVWIRLGNCRTKALVAALDHLWPKLEIALKAGDRVIELR